LISDAMAPLTYSAAPLGEGGEAAAPRLEAGLMQRTESSELTGFRRWWALLWPVASPINLPEADDRKMHYGYTEHNGKLIFSSLKSI